jgi:hypothetical protein
MRASTARDGPYKIVQTPDLIVILYESQTMFRQVFTMDIEIVIDDPKAVG